jgi:DNA-binding NarL/FixJ family response regulator
VQDWNSAERGRNGEMPPRRPERLRVLVCEDTDALRAEVGRSLRAAGMDVVGEAADGVVALQLARDERPDAIVLDLGLPGRSGLDLLPLLRRVLPDARIVVFSGFESATTRANARERGANAVVGKSRPIEELVAALAGDGAGESSHEPRATPPDPASVVRRLHDGPVQELTAALLTLQSAAESGAVPPEVARDAAARIGRAASALRALMSELSA